tara:strand:- start:9571 stop:9996 length:426 start_codon:yes stop_codon:yes gene_type:complete
MTDQFQTNPPEKPLKENGSLIQQYGKVLLLWGCIIAGILFLLYFGVDNKIIALTTITIGLLTKAFAGLGALIALIPIAGPLIIKIVTLPFFWLLNGLGYFVSIIAIKKGYNSEMINSRVLTIALLIGVLIGYIVGHIIPIR